ncbi:MAG: hypothetical protein HZB42_03725 [Sphingobacteriales bacterium]|nr:hypothetical protein [Sphingobacteriales bacterium]
MGCTEKEEKQKSNVTEVLQTNILKTYIEPAIEYGCQGASQPNSIRNVKADTSTLIGKREYIWNQYVTNNAPPEDDTLFDLNYDGNEDYVIRYYGLAGNGFKHRIEVYLFNKKRRVYIQDSLLSSFVNPSFYIAEKKITEFYIASTGWGSRWEWINNKWIATKEFEVDNKGDSTIWTMYYPLKRETEKIKRPFQMIPPPEILEIKDIL